jgi:radical SAM protein with 4Fe4S-binding SPASM domain
MEDRTTFRPALVSWNLTRKCNLNCPHCYLDAGDADEDELSTRECLELIGELDALGTEMLILTGGEPLLRRDIYEIASAASSRGMWVVMGTNGVLVNEHVAQKMIECGVKGVGISIDSVDPERHDAFRGGPGSSVSAWKHSMRALEICRSHGLEVLVQSTITRENRDELPALVDLARSAGAWSFNLYFLVRTGRGMEMNDLTAEETDACLRDLIGFQDDAAPMLVRAKCAPQFKQVAFELGRGGLESGGCMAGTEYCRISPQGDVTPCPYMDLVAGSVRDAGFATVWRDSPVLNRLRDPSALGGRCGDCEFSELCGGCRCRAYAATGDPLAEDPACTYVPGTLSIDADAPVTFSDPVLERLNRIPIGFIRGKVRSGVETYAVRHGIRYVTSADMDAALAGSRTMSLPDAAMNGAFAKEHGQSTQRPPGRRPADA